MIDTHCHLTFPEFAGDVEGVLAEAARAGVTGLITISTTPGDAEACLQIAEQHDRVWCTSGVHPLYADQAEDRAKDRGLGSGSAGHASSTFDWAAVARVARSPRCVAWGELGLDRHYDKPPLDLQKRVLAEHIAAIESSGIDKPVVIHCRKAFDDLLPILRASAIIPSRFVFHCFTGSADDARAVLDFGAMLSFTGVVTYPNAPEVREAATLVPADRIMVETDAPYLAPVPHRGKRPCRPAWVRHTAEAIAKIRGVPFDEFHRAINANTERFFGISTAKPAASNAQPSSGRSGTPSSTPLGLSEGSG